MRDSVSPPLAFENDPGDALLLRVDSVGGDPLSLAASMDALEVHRLSEARASDSRPPVSQLGRIGRVEPRQPVQPPRPELAEQRSAGVGEGFASGGRVERAHAPISAEAADLAPGALDLRPTPPRAASRSERKNFLFSNSGPRLGRLPGPAGGSRQHKPSKPRRAIGR